MARGFQAFDYADKQLSAKVAADGTAQVAFGPVDAGHIWRVTRAFVGAEGSALEGPALLYVGDILPQYLRDGTNNGTLDIAEYPAPLVVPGTQSLYLVWSGLTPGATVFGAIQYEDLVEVVVPSAPTLTVS